MAVLEIQSNGDSSYVSQEAINSAIQSLEDPLQRVSPSPARNAALETAIQVAPSQFCVCTVAGIYPEVSGGGSQEATHRQGAAVSSGLVRGALTEAAGCPLHRQPPA